MKREARAITIVATLAIWALLLLIASDSNASVEPISPRPIPARVIRYLNMAESWWGEAPEDCTSYTILVSQQLFVDGVKANGAATLPSFPQACIMWLSHQDQPRDECVTVFHEYGHWLGLPHSDNPRSIMYPTGPLRAPGPCNRVPLRWYS